jgi:hypothetical protein
MSFGSMQYTIGTMLDRAQTQEYSVAVLVEGQWIPGRVVSADSVGVVIESEQGDHTVVRLDRISAVRAYDATTASAAAGGSAGSAAGDAGPGGAMPMPGPRQSSD